MNPQNDVIVELNNNLRLRRADGLWRLEQEGWSGRLADRDIEKLMVMARIRGLVDAQTTGMIRLHLRHKVDPGAIT